MLEKQLEKKLKTEVEKLGGLCLKLQTPGFTGIPDRLVIMPGGKIWFVEMKAPGETPEPRQDYVKEQLSRTGCNVRVLSTEKEVETFLVWLNYNRPLIR